jgi:hypothetical protein
MVSGASFISKKIKRPRILKKISPKNIPVPSESGIRDTGSGKIHPGSGSRIQGVKSTGSQIRNTALIQILFAV